MGFGEREGKETKETEKHLKIKRTNPNDPYNRHRNDNISLGFELEFSHL